MKLASRIRFFTAAACIVLFASACGGGGAGAGGGTGLDNTGAGGSGTSLAVGEPGASDPNESFNVTFEVFQPDGLKGSFIVGSNNYPMPFVVPIRARFDHEPKGVFYPVIVDAQHVFDSLTGPIANKQNDGAYTAILLPRVPEKRATYRGNLELKLCKDPSCASEFPLTGGQIAYDYEYVEDVVLSAKVNGRAVKDIRGLGSVTSGQTLQAIAAVGDMVEVQSNIPVTWTIPPAGLGSYLLVSEQTDLHVVGTITSGDMNGGVSIQAMPIGSNYKYYSTTQFIRQ